MIRLRDHARALVPIAILVAVAMALWLAIQTERAGENADIATPSRSAALADRTAQVEDPQLPHPSERIVDPGSLRPTRIRLTGRCVACENAMPILGCRVELDALTAGATESDGERCVVELATESDRDGRFAFDDQLAAGSGAIQRLRIRAWREDRAPEWRSYDVRTDQDPAIDAGDLALASGAVLTGVALDQRGLPVPETSISLRDLVLPSPPRLPIGADHSRSLPCAADGTFSSDEPIPFGTWSLAVDSPMHHLVGARYVVIRPGQPPLRLELAIAPTIRGIVCDENGMPLAAVPVGTMVNYEPCETTSDEAGRFVLSAPILGPTPTWLSAETKDLEQVSENVGIRWGSDDVRIVLRRRAFGCVTVRVVEAGSGRPVRGFVVWSEQTSSPDREGIASLERLKPELHRFTVVPNDLSLRPARSPECIVLAERSTEITVAVERLRPVEVLVHDVDAKPIRDARVALLDTAQDWSWRQPKNRRRWLLRSRSPDSSARRTAHLVLAEGATGGDGRATLFAANDGSGSILVEAPGHAPAQFDAPWTRDAAGIIRLPVAREASVSGELRGLDPAWRAAILLVPDGSGRESWSTNSPLTEHVGEGGAFRFAAVPPGDWQPHVRIVDRSDDSPEFGMALPLSMPDLQVEPGGSHRLLLDASACRSARLRGTVTHGGELLPRCELFLRRVQEAQGDVGRLFRTIPIGHSGRFELPGVPPGLWLLRLSFQSESGAEVWIDPDAPVELVSGQTLERTIDFPRRMLRVRVLLPDRRSPAAGVPVGTIGASAVTGADGVALLGPIQSRTTCLASDRFDPIFGIEFPRGGGELMREVVVRK